MKLKDILNEIKITKKANYKPELEIKSIHVDSREVQEGGLFVCIIGENNDGHEFALDVVKKGVYAVITSKELDLGVSQIVVENTSEAVSKIAANFYDNPTKKLNVIGITGTNGKTTSTFIVKHILDEVGEKCGLIGTIGVDTGNKFYPAVLTTPQAVDLQKHFAEMVSNGCKHVVMEVSSHALDLRRVDNIDFDIAAITNISQDHLDYHKDMGSYIKAKAKLFEMANKTSIINFDDKYKGAFIDASINRPFLYSCSSSVDNGLYAIIQRSHALGMEFDVYYNKVKYPVSTKLIGKFNAYNILLALSIVINCGVDISKAINVIESFNAVDGRFERVQGIKDFTVIVDYAHTPDALENVLRAARSITKNRLITVFGCGGDRDSTKRPLMGQISQQLSDYVIITSDNPRTEDPKRIIDDILEGVKTNNCVKIIIDRENAIKEAIIIANVGDVILIAGKGHETYQIIGKDKIDFDDRKIALKIYDEVR